MSDSPITGGIVFEYWKKSTRSLDGDCVEISANRVDGGARIRDSKDPEGPRLSFTQGEWRAFVDGVKAGEFDR